MHLYLLFMMFLGLLGITKGHSISYAHWHAAIPVTICDQAHLQTAITTAVADDTITFQCSGTIILTSTLTISKNLTLNGSGQNVTLDGNNAVTVLSVSSGVHFTLNAITIAHGHASLYGGGIYDDGTVDIKNATFTNNVADSEGGAIFHNGNGTLSIASSTLINNVASIGGAVASTDRTGTINITTSTFDNNQASNAGAVANSETMNISASTFVNNSASFRAAALDNDRELNITNSTFSNNKSSSGVIYNLATGTVKLTYSTLANNNGDGAGVITNFGTMTIGATILSNQTNCFGAVTDGGYNLENGTSCGFTAPTDLQKTDPKLVSALANNGGPTQTLALQNNSPAINRIPPNLCVVAADQRGMSRPQGPGCEIGAFEFRAPILTLPSNPITVAATSPQGAVVKYTVTGSLPDDPNNPAIVKCTPASDSTFPAGTTTVQCTASDSATIPDVTSGSFQVVVTTSAPTLHLPPDITQDATSDQGSTINYKVTATDPSYPSDQLTIACQLPSGSMFPVGDNTVHCSATNPAGATTTGSFPITINNQATPVSSPTPTMVPPASPTPTVSVAVIPTVTAVASPTATATVSLPATIVVSPTAVVTASPTPLPPDLSLKLSHEDQPHFLVGDRIMYHIDTQNGDSAGLLTTANSIQVTSTIPIGFRDLHATGQDWQITLSSTTSPALLTAVYQGSYPILLGGHLPGIVLQGQFTSDAMPQLLLSATVSAPGDTNKLNDTGYDTLLVTAVPLTATSEPTLSAAMTPVMVTPVEQSSSTNQGNETGCDNCHEGNNEDLHRNDEDQHRDNGNHHWDDDDLHLTTLHHDNQDHFDHAPSFHDEEWSKSASAHGYPALPNTGSDPYGK
ncbi:hypothetical protein KDA_21660 [Dictyobacter alpinus]|uniref:HYR domain-containing protein n=2 Tax=Dictyobacter alpinus TaxID=2014873 RepID=A0A402B5Q3_9CHLR|nr:hypothetical protein KDA_21660 [Dictyobacter alpinus]